jgi:imidazole glycerol-phosphate synthase subunit HisH
VNVTLIDSPFSNAANIARALRACDAKVDVTRDPAVVRNAARLVLPGVGAFAAAMNWLTETGIDEAIREAVANDAALLGICVGHQLLFDVSCELGETRGLGLLRGEVRKLDGPLPVPQIGWNRVRWNAVVQRPSGGRPEAHTTRLFDGIERDTPFYFVNSYAVCGADAEVASADYGRPFTAAAASGRVFGVQFHPEKSSFAGLRVLRNFITCN